MHCKALHLSSSQYALLLAHCQTPVNKTMEERMGRGVPLFVEPERPEEVVERIVYLLENVKDIQRILLENLLKKHGDCEYLEKYKKDGKIDVQTFRERVPLITYEDIQRDIQRTAQRGKHANILCCEEPVHFHQRKSTVKRTSAGGIGMTFFFGGDCLKTPGGHDLLLVSSWFVRQSMSAYRQTPERFASPLEVILCRDFAQSVYCQLLCGLIRSAEVAMMSSLIISVLATAVTFLQENWEELCNDISTGKLSARITDQKVRRAVSQILHTPDPELAAKIRAECSKDTWAGILTRLWPNLRFISGICTGSLLQFVDHFEFFTDHKVPVVCLVYGSSEGAIGMNPYPDAHPNDITYVFLPQMGYFEFRNIRDSSVVDISDVVVGEDYEFIMTNLSGLWRYKMADVLKCVGYIHSSPEFKFLGRENTLVNVAQEIVHEYEMTLAVESAAKLHLFAGAHLMGYTTTVNVKSFPGHYVVFWELQIEHSSAEGEHQEELEQCCLAIENSLNEKYRADRNMGTIAPLEINLVKPGSFSNLMQQAQATRCSTQLKQTRTYKPDHPAVQFLYSAAQHKFRSSKALTL
ncbi:hypothetical protein Mp_2g14010 [Marchantia polymorpha subsp. ruderalis]|uniref:Uncharacterized protein n=1 Tax=Marchantia polymorpha TaxID=3197 RepID=A0A2R6X1L2_MARPO|nr:hypothetical protein MARPO_0042s0030 [Marchantia polymorpha]BBN02279.1 hypothetical protein Mp_2g14010 [Marchantia polymorpha subsp. ruderalis]|eukprot:PTQ39980.1 hypothetical protein MARPO_0042s0030 [Marchantia polymorpha]